MSIEGGANDYNRQMMQAAYDFVWTIFQKREFAATARFTAIAVRLSFHPDARLSGAEEPQTSFAEDSRITTQAAVATYEVVDITRVTPEAEAAGITMGAELTRLTTDVRREPMLGGDNEHEIVTEDHLRMLDTSVEPPKLLGEYNRPPVTSVMGGKDGREVTEQRIEIPLPNYETLFAERQPQHEYIALLGAVAEVRSVDVSPFPS